MGMLQLAVAVADLLGMFEFTYVAWKRSDLIDILLGMQLDEMLLQFPKPGITLV